MTLVECRRVTKRFGALVALSEVSLSVRAGEILGLIGPNGSGKTTLFNLMVGVHSPDEGEILFKGRPIGGLRPHQICWMGMAKTCQIVQPFQDMTVRENVRVAALYGKKRSRREADRETERILKWIGLYDWRDESVRKVPLGARRRLELARALATGAEVLLLDEVLAGLNPAEIEEMLKLLRTLKAQGLTLLLVEHVMRVIIGIAERVAVLNYGRKIAEGSPQEITSHPEVIQAYLGDRYV